MTFDQLVSTIADKQSFLSVGLDPDLSKIPVHLLNHDNPVLEFCKSIIDATLDLCVAYKPNTAFFETQGAAGWETLQKVIEYIPETHLTIADAKRGDIGNTSGRYAKAILQQLGADAITIAPYMGEDSVSPFLELADRWVILLALTSNKGSADFQLQKMEDGRFLYEHVLEASAKWGTKENMMFVVGATHPKDFTTIRNYIPDHFLLVPGIGAQGGSLAEVCEYGMNKDCGLLVNSSRGIIYAGKDEHYKEAVREEAHRIQQEMATILSQKSILV